MKTTSLGIKSRYPKIDGKTAFIHLKKSTVSKFQDTGSNGTTQIMFVAFLFVITITISNLIVGLTVNRTEALFKEAGVIRLMKTVLQVSCFVANF